MFRNSLPAKVVVALLVVLGPVALVNADIMGVSIPTGSMDTGNRSGPYVA